MRVILHRPGHHFEVRDASCERVRGCLEDENGRRLARRDRFLQLLPVLHGRHLGALQGRWQNLSDEVEQQVRPDVLSRSGAKYRENAPLPHRFLQAGDDVLDGKRSAGKKLLHQFVVSFGNHLDQGFVRGCGRFAHRVGNITFFSFPVAARAIAPRAHPNEIDNTSEVLLTADWKLNGDGTAAKALVNAFHCAFK